MRGMTPEKARELRDNAARGPWEVKAEEFSTCGDLIEGLAAWVESDNEFVFGRGMEIEDDEELKNLALAAAAPALAEIVANLRYEYAVQNRVGDEWLYEDMRGRNLSPDSTEHIVWWSHPIPQADIEDRGEGMARVVRRLVGEPEVVE